MANDTDPSQRKATFAVEVRDDNGDVIETMNITGTYAEVEFLIAIVHRHATFRSYTTVSVEILR